MLFGVMIQQNGKKKDRISKGVKKIQDFAKRKIVLKCFVMIKYSTLYKKQTSLNNQMWGIENFQFESFSVDFFKQQIRKIKQDLERSQQFDLIRKLKTIQLQNDCLKSKISSLNKSLQQVNQRQNRQSNKKKEVLEMLAEELQEKNNTIQQLKRQIKMGIKSNEILQEQNNDYVNEIVEKLKNSEKLVDNYRKNQDKFNLKFKKMQNVIAEYQQKLKLLEKQREFYQNQKYKMLSKTRRIQKYLKEVQKNYTNSNIQSNQFENNMKLEILFNFLQKFPDFDIDIDIFTQHENQIIQKLVLQWQNLQSQIRNFYRQTPQNNKDEVQFSQFVVHKSQNRINAQQHSIFEFFDSMSDESQNQKVSKCAISIMQIEQCKKTLNQKIEQLKARLLIGRQIILKFLTILEEDFRQKLKKQSAFDAILQFFQYSQMQRSQMFSKKRSFLSFLSSDIF